MKIQILIITFILFFAPAQTFSKDCFDASTHQRCSSSENIFASPQDEVEAGFAEAGWTIFVAGNEDLGKPEELPWVETPRGLFLGRLDELKVKPNWMKLADKPVQIHSEAGTVRLAIANAGDERAGRAGRPDVKFEPGKIQLDIRLWRKDGPYEKNYHPTLFCVIVHLEHVVDGEYDIYLHSTLAGKIKVVSDKPNHGEPIKP